MDRVRRRTLRWRRRRSLLAGGRGRNGGSRVASIVEWLRWLEQQQWRIEQRWLVWWRRRRRLGRTARAPLKASCSTPSDPPAAACVPSPAETPRPGPDGAQAAFTKLRPTAAAGCRESDHPLGAGLHLFAARP